MSNILVLAGGSSNEREVSLRSGKAVADALRGAGHNVVIRDPSDTGGSVTKMKNINDIEVIFPVLHGAGGEDGTIQIKLDELGKPYVGSDPIASALCFDKWLYRQTLREAQLPVAQAALVTPESFRHTPLTQKPYVLKPVRGGSSIDTFVIRTLRTADKNGIHAALERYGEMLLEELVEGVEITVGVLGNEALPVVEIIPPTDGEFDYENKYNGKSQEVCPPIHVSPDLQQRAQELAVKAHTLTNCRDLSRTDMIVKPDGKIIILETNTGPGMTDQSLYPKAGAAAGIPMNELADRLVKMALARGRG